MSISVAVNADSLATWFMPALGQLASQHRILLDLIVDDQEHTYEVLESGMAIGCVSTQAKAMKGCFAAALGSMQYRLVATPAFAAQWFADGLNRNAARVAPVVAQTHKDELQAAFLKKNIWACRHAAIPVITCQHRAATQRHRGGHSYGMLPQRLIGPALDAGSLVDLAPAHTAEVALFWHAWQVQSPRLEALSSQFVARAQALLAQP